MFNVIETWGPIACDLQRLRRINRFMNRWICGTKDQNETPPDSLIQKIGIEDIQVVLPIRWPRWLGHVKRVLYQICHRLNDFWHFWTWIPVPVRTYYKQLCGNIKTNDVAAWRVALLMLWLENGPNPKQMPHWCQRGKYAVSCYLFSTVFRTNRNIRPDLDP